MHPLSSKFKKKLMQWLSNETIWRMWCKIAFNYTVSRLKLSLKVAIILFLTQVVTLRFLTTTWLIQITPIKLTVFPKTVQFSNLLTTTTTNRSIQLPSQFNHRVAEVEVSMIITKINNFLSSNSSFNNSIMTCTEVINRAQHMINSTLQLMLRITERLWTPPL
jgi:hypothetical protein